MSLPLLPQSRVSPGALSFAALSVLLWSATAFAGPNRLQSFVMQGDGRIDVKFVDGKVASNDVWVPPATIKLQCLTSGYRPDSVMYGIVPLAYGVQRGHASLVQWNAAKQGLAEKTQQFPTRRLWVKAAKHQNPLRVHQEKAMAMCMNGNGGTLKISMRAGGRCRRVKMGFGKTTHDFELGRDAMFKVVCVGKPKTAPSPPPSTGPSKGPSDGPSTAPAAPGRPGKARHARPRDRVGGRPRP